MADTPERIAHIITRGEPFDQLSEFEREWAKNIFQAALQTDRANTAERIADLERLVGKAAEVLDGYGGIGWEEFEALLSKLRSAIAQPAAGEREKECK